MCIRDRYKVAKKLQLIIKNSIKLQDNHSVKNNLEFIEKIKNIDVLPSYKLVSFDIVNLYTCLLYTSRCV